MRNHRMCGVTLNVYGGDAVVWEDWGVEKTPPKSGSLFALHTQALSCKYRLLLRKSVEIAHNRKC